VIFTTYRAQSTHAHGIIHETQLLLVGLRHKQVLQILRREQTSDTKRPTLDAALLTSLYNSMYVIRTLTSVYEAFNFVRVSVTARATIPCLDLDNETPPHSLRASRGGNYFSSTYGSDKSPTMVNVLPVPV
jgi:hypothetical protein